jgi:hypothetical protein
MRHISMMLSLLLMVTFTFLTTDSAVAQDKEVRKSLRASVTQRLGVDTDVTFDFGRPGVKERKIWGELVPYGMYPGNKYSDNKPYPWRAGADENTTVEFSKDVKIDGKKVAAGKYGIHMIPSEKEWTVIFNKKNDNWGSFGYDESQDALRITVKTVKAEHQEWLNYGFDNLDGTKATAFMHWEKVKVPFSIEVASE